MALSIDYFERMMVLSERSLSQDDFPQERLRQRDDLILILISASGNFLDGVPLDTFCA